MSDKDLLGVGGEVPSGQEAIRLFDPAGTFATDDPYLLADGKSLQAPVPAISTDQATYFASDGSLQSAWGAPSVGEYPWVLESGTWESGKYWLENRDW